MGEYISLDWKIKPFRLQRFTKSSILKGKTSASVPAMASFSLVFAFCFVLLLLWPVVSFAFLADAPIARVCAMSVVETVG